jgi:anaphase-promoting complex subunit 11
MGSWPDLVSTDGLLWTNQTFGFWGRIWVSPKWPCALCHFTETPRSIWGTANKYCDLQNTRHDSTHPLIKHMQIKVNTWTVPAYWSWDVKNEDVCGICQVAYDACCPTCTVPGDGCPLIWGECSHVFHMHCLIKWLNAPNSQEQCPMDRIPWKTAAAQS